MCRQEQVAGETLSVMVRSTEPGVQRLGVKYWLFHMNYVTLNHSGSFCVRRSADDDDDDSFTQIPIGTTTAILKYMLQKEGRWEEAIHLLSDVLCFHLQSHSPF